MPMKLARTTVAGLAAVTLVLGGATTACGGDNAASPGSSSTAPTTTTSAPLADYTSLLVKVSDIGEEFATPQPPQLNANNQPGVTQLFVNADNSRQIGDAIMVVADAKTAAAGLESTKGNYATKLGGAPWQPAEVGSNGAMAAGTSPDKSHSVTVLLFTEGRALVSLEFDSNPNDPIDRDIALDIGRKQDAAIKANLPS
jgi:hypothetical protein